VLKNISKVYKDIMKRKYYKKTIFAICMVKCNKKLSIYSKKLKVILSELYFDGTM